MDRRRFVSLAAWAGFGAVFGGCGSKARTVASGPGRSSAGVKPTGAEGDVYIGSSKNPVEALEAALEKSGALDELITPGSTVVLKPNVAWARKADQAATTNPDIVGAIVRLCKKADAKKVIVFEHTIDKPGRMVFGISGVGKAASEAGADVVIASSESDFVPLEIPRGKLLRSDTIARTLLDADVVINMPKAKRHSATELTLGLKNLMGVIWNRQAWHSGPDLHQYIADYATAAPVGLTIIDASRALMSNGPKGPGETRDFNEVIVAFDPVAADAYACTLFGMSPAHVAHITKAAELGLGVADVSKIRQVRA